MSAYTVRPAVPSDLGALPAIEAAAAAMFPEADLPARLRSESTPSETFAAAQEEGRLWVACASSGEPVGFALARDVDGEAHLDEMDVHPRHGRRGLGARLLREVVAWARAGRRGSITLTTFAHLPWNAPFYAREGFRVLDAHELGPELAEILHEDSARGLRNRVAMAFSLRPRV